MPEVPRTARVRQTGIPGVQVQETAPAAAFGAGPQVAGVFQAATSLARQGEKIAVEEKRQVDIQRSTGANMGMVKEKNDLLNSFEQLEGLAPLEQTDDFLTDFDKRSQTISEGLQNDTQRNAYSRAAANIRAEFGQRLQRHSSTQKQKHDTIEFDNNLTISKNDIIGNFENKGKVRAGLESQRAMIEDRGFNKKWNRDRIKLEILKHSTETHLGVLERMVNNDQATAAKQYFKEVKDEIVSTERDGAKSIIDAGIISDQSKAHAEEILIEAQGSKGLALGLVSEITNDDVRKETNRIVSNAHALQDRTQKAQEADAMNNAIAFITEKKGFTAHHRNASAHK